ncbi:PREDICTED: endogenous retrovirus group S71 member 1 Env polyprotein-like [Hipposideros armiger]|uniref:Endogenous retrovirus group S71 member 1 Env polyprotein-like n=1 Tax=Hipposideros armiger TaxID=186990 RepID=A0A8B7QP98_HIPAR|nr:PREDICTED: endogenous retrovirus group S71 member 1 Env polyprotein-like [Hipposideros armiger]
MANPQWAQRYQDKTGTGPRLFTSLLTVYSLFLVTPTRAHGPHPHAPVPVKWEIRATGTGTIYASHIPSPFETSISLQVDLCKINIPFITTSHPQSYSCRGITHERSLEGTQFYACPASSPPRCISPGEYNCAAWGCETTASWKQEDPHISISLSHNSSCRFIGTCNPLKISITSPGAPFWSKGKTWGLRLYLSGPDLGTQITIQKSFISRPLTPIGPNRDFVLPAPALPPKPTVFLPTSSIPLSPSLTSFPIPSLSIPTPPPQPLLLQMLATFHALLNASNPADTADCWLCFDPKPPYYIGIGASSSSALLLVPQGNCSWTYPSLTLRNLLGQGTCIYSTSYPISTSPYAPLCSSTILIINSTISTLTGLSTFFRAPDYTWFACTNGITKCLDLYSLSPSIRPPLFCYLVHILPQVSFYSGEGGREHLSLLQTRYCWATPILIPLLVTVSRAGSTAIGTSSLVLQDQNFKSLSHQVAQDLGYLEYSVSRLANQVDSLAEVVLQNRRGLDLLFLKQGGLCVALGETCCFYANQSGIIHNTLGSGQS